VGGGRARAGPLNHLDDEVDSDQYVVNTELSLWGHVCHLRGESVVDGGDSYPLQPQRLGIAILSSHTYLRLIDSCITQLKAQGPSRTCNESKEEEEEEATRIAIPAFPRARGNTGLSRTCALRECQLNNSPLTLFQAAGAWRGGGGGWGLVRPNQTARELGAPAYGSSAKGRSLQLAREVGLQGYLGGVTGVPRSPAREVGLQGYLTHKKLPPARTLQ